MNSDEELTECFRVVGERYGYDRILARYADFRDLKVRWQRTTSVIEFSVSDYLRTVPDEVTCQLAETLFAKIAGERRGYPKELENWIGRREFADEHRPVYLKRVSKVIEDPEGDCKDLTDVETRLINRGLLSEDDDITLVWSNEKMFSRCTKVSVVMRVVLVSKQMDAEDVPDYVLDWVVYREMCHILVGFDPNGSCRCDEEDDLVSRFPLRDQAEKWLSERERRERCESSGNNSGNQRSS